MDISQFSDDNIRGCCHFPRKVYDNKGNNFTLKPNINYETNLGFNYKQLANKTSLEWLYPELIEIQANRAKQKKERVKADKKRFEGNRKNISGLTNFFPEKNLGSLSRVSELLRGFEMPSQSILDQANIANRWLEQNKGLIDHSKDAFKHHQALIQPAWADQLAKNRELIDHLSCSSYFIKSTALLQKYKAIDQAYLESTKTALSAFGKGLNHIDLLSPLYQYAKYTEKALSTGMATNTALAMLEPHRGISENLHLRLREYESEEKTEGPEETAELRKALEQKDKEIAELKALIDKNENQDKELVKQTRKNQMHFLIWNIDTFLRAGRSKTPAIEIWNELTANHLEYPEGEIIQSFSDNVIEWKSCHGNESSLALTSLASVISKARKKYKGLEK